MTVRSIHAESGSTTPARVPLQAASSDETVTEGPPVDGRRALRGARRRRRRTAWLCAAVVLVCLALTLLIVGLARDRPAPAAASTPGPTATVPVAASAAHMTTLVRPPVPTDAASA